MVRKCQMSDFYTLGTGMQHDLSELSLPHAHRARLIQ